MFALITGTLWKDPVARVLKNGNSYATGIIKSGTPTEALWCNAVVFDEAAQDELLQLSAGDSLSVQGLAKISLFERNGTTRASLDVQAAKILSLRPPKQAPKHRAVSKPKPEMSAPSIQGPDWDGGVPSSLG